MKSRVELQNMDDLYKEIFSRNIGFFTESEQERLRRATIAIAGVGGIGGLLSERLIRLGVDCLKIADPGSFEVSNLNRQFCSSIPNLGSNKAEVVFSQIKDINPQARIDWNKTGIKTQDDAEFFLDGCDLIIDAMDFGLFKQAVLLQREARRRGIYYLFASAVGFGALVVIFAPDGMTLEEYNGLPADTDLNNEEELKVSLERICPVIPTYAIPASEEAERIVQEIISGKRGAPTNSIGVGLASILSANEAMNILLKKRDICVAPQYTYIDLIEQKFLVGTIS